MTRTALWRGSGRHHALLALVVLTAGCRAAGERPGVVFLPEMYASVPYDSYDANPVTPNGQTLLLPPAGTVPMGFEVFPYGPGKEEAARAGREVVNPFSATPENVKRGRHVYENVCVVCHGPGGQGDGPIVGRFPNPPSLTSERAQALGDGQIVHIVTYGQGLMPSHAAQVLLEDRYRLALHLRVLQGGQRDEHEARP